MKIYTNYLDSFWAIKRYLDQNHIPNHRASDQKGADYILIPGKISPKGMRAMQEYFESEEVQCIIEGE